MARTKEGHLAEESEMVELNGRIVASEGQILHKKAQKSPQIAYFCLYDQILNRIN